MCPDQLKCKLHTSHYTLHLCPQRVFYIFKKFDIIALEIVPIIAPHTIHWAKLYPKSASDFIEKV